MTVMGAGGAAKAIIYETLKRGVHVCVWNRTHEKVLELAKKWPIEVLERLTPSAVVIITTPLTPDFPYLDIGLHSEFGKRMWHYQALGQHRIWFNM